MIVVTVALLSANGRHRDRDLGRVLIANDGTGTAARGNYNVVAVVPRARRRREGRVEGFPRGSRSALDLLRRALDAVHENGGLP